MSLGLDLRKRSWLCSFYFWKLNPEKGTRSEYCGRFLCVAVLHILCVFFFFLSEIVVMGSSAMSIDEVVEELMRLNKSLPIRPGIDEVEAAKVLILNVEKEEQMRLETIARQSKRKDVPDELFKILQEMQRNLVDFQSKEQKREALKLLDLENVHYVFDELIQRASKCLSSNPLANTSSASSRNSSSLSLANSSSFSGSSFNSPATTTTTTSFYSEKEPVKVPELVTRDDSYLKKPTTTFQMDGISFGIRSGNASYAPQIVDSTLKTSTGQDGEKMSLIKLASLIEVSAKKRNQGANSSKKIVRPIRMDS